MYKLGDCFSWVNWKGQTEYCILCCTNVITLGDTEQIELQLIHTNGSRYMDPVKIYTDTDGNYTITKATIDRLDPLNQLQLAAYHFIPVPNTIDYLTPSTQTQTTDSGPLCSDAAGSLRQSVN